MEDESTFEDSPWLIELSSPHGRECEFLARPPFYIRERRFNPRDWQSKFASSHGGFGIPAIPFTRDVDLVIDDV
jgi:hypothetical protein